MCRNESAHRNPGAQLWSAYGAWDVFVDILTWVNSLYQVRGEKMPYQRAKLCLDIHYRQATTLLKRIQLYWMTGKECVFCSLGPLGSLYCLGKAPPHMHYNRKESSVDKYFFNMYVMYNVDSLNLWKKNSLKKSSTKNLINTNYCPAVVYLCRPMMKEITFLSRQIPSSRNIFWHRPSATRC